MLISNRWKVEDISEYSNGGVAQLVRAQDS